MYDKCILSSFNAVFLLCVSIQFSGGEGCILGAGGSVIGIGSDIGGSIRMPSFFCGVFGHRPTSGKLFLLYLA